MFLGCFGTYAALPQNHKDWAMSMLVPSINPTNPRTYLWNFCKKCWVGHFWPFFTNFFFKFFFSSTWKSVKGSWILRMGRNVDEYPGFQPKNQPPQTFQSPVYNSLEENKFIRVFFFIRKQYCSVFLMWISWYSVLLFIDKVEVQNNNTELHSD